MRKIYVLVSKCFDESGNFRPPYSISDPQYVSIRSVWGFPFLEDTEDNIQNLKTPSHKELLDQVFITPEGEYKLKSDDLKERSFFTCGKKFTTGAHIYLECSVHADFYDNGFTDYKPELQKKRHIPLGLLPLGLLPMMDEEIHE